MRARIWRGAMSASLAVAGIAFVAAAGLSLTPMVDNKPYIAPADLHAMSWIEANVPAGSYVLANPFAFPWDTSEKRAIQGSDAGPLDSS